MLVRGVHIKEEHAALFHEKSRVGNGGIQVRDVVEGIEGRHRTPDGAVEVKLEQILLQKQQLAGKAQLFRLIPHNTEHLLGLIDADHIIARLCQHQGQLPCSTTQIGQNAIPDIVGIQFLPDLLIKAS